MTFFCKSCNCIFHLYILSKYNQLKKKENATVSCVVTIGKIQSEPQLGVLLLNSLSSKQTIGVLVARNRKP